MMRELRLVSSLSRVGSNFESNLQTISRNYQIGDNHNILRKIINFLDERQLKEILESSHKRQHETFDSNITLSNDKMGIANVLLMNNTLCVFQDQILRVKLETLLK